MSAPSALDRKLVQAAEPSAVDFLLTSNCVHTRQQIEGKWSLSAVQKEETAEHNAGWPRHKTTLSDLQEGRFEDAEEDEQEPTETGQHHS